MTAARKPKPYKYIPLPPDFCPAICTFDEACSYARHSRWTGHQKVKEGRWRTFRDGRLRKVIFASVLEDMERTMAIGSDKIEPVIKRKRGRPPKPRPEERPQIPAE